MPAFPDHLAKKLRQSGVLAVLVIDDASDAIPLAEALLAGGVHAMELTLRTPAALNSIDQIANNVPDMVVGAGTVLSASQVHVVKQAGAAFAVSPGTNPATLAAAREAKLPFAPGVCTPTDIEIATDAGCKLMKFFPSEASGGLAYLRQIAAPFAHLGVGFIPLGGINPANLQSYLRDEFVSLVGGSWIASRELLARRDWKSITANALQATRLVKDIRG